MEQTKEKKYIVGSILCGLLTAFGIVACFISLAGGSNGIWFICDCVLIALLLLSLFYALIGYKKPHGNLLKYLILARAAFNLIALQTLIPTEDTFGILSRAIEIGLLCYIAGRLAKAKENLILMIITSVVFVISLVAVVASGTATIGAVSPLIVWLDICVAYFLRYKQHREAGLEDAPKSK